MKYIIASDIHGSAYYCEQLISAFKKEKADKILLLGDILYHGPRNDLPRGHNPKEVIKLLNPLKNSILCVRGNCEAEVDQMVLSFPCMADYCVLPMGNNIIFATHGHVFNEENLPPLNEGDILMNGHTHVPKVTEHEDYVYMNPGSVAIPKEGSPHSYMVWEERSFIWTDLESGEVYKKYEF